MNRVSQLFYKQCFTRVQQALLVSVFLFAGTAFSSVATLEFSNAQYSKSISTSGAAVEKSFVTDSGVYVLDIATKKLRVFPRTAAGKELEDCTFRGKDADGNGVLWNKPVAFAKRPGANIIAVADAYSYNPSMGMYPTVQFYEFTEEVNAAGALTNVTFKTIDCNPSGEAFDTDALEEQALAFTSERGLVSPCFSMLVDIEFDSRGGIVCGIVDKDESYANSFILRVGSYVYSAGATLESVQIANPDGKAYCKMMGIAVDLATDQVWAAFSTAHVVMNVDNPTQCFGTVGMAGNTDSKLNTPHDLVVSSSTTSASAILYIADRGNSRIVLASPKKSEAVAVFGTLGNTGALTMRNPNGVYTTEDGLAVAVADTGNGRVRVFRLDGEFFENLSFATLPTAAILSISDADMTDLTATYTAGTTLATLPAAGAWPEIFPGNVVAAVYADEGAFDMFKVDFEVTFADLIAQDSADLNWKSFCCLDGSQSLPAAGSSGFVSMQYIFGESSATPVTIAFNARVAVTEAADGKLVYTFTFPNAFALALYGDDVDESFYTDFASYTQAKAANGFGTQRYMFIRVRAQEK